MNTKTLLSKPCHVTTCRDFLDLFRDCIPSAENFVMKHGIWMPYRCPPTHVVLNAKLHHCFQNAYDFSVKNSDFTYCEGFAKWNSSVPVLHAWLRDAEGYVFDPTWSRSLFTREDNREYFGVPFHSQYVSRSFNARGKYGILDDWENKWPVTKEDRDTFFQP